jgi:hypothetical protein
MTLAMHVVLIVQDDEPVQDVLQTLFNANGFRVVTAETELADYRPLASTVPTS